MEQITLGELIQALYLIDENAEIDLASPHSYRGYYNELALEPRWSKAWILREELETIIDTELTGWKGGEFLMESSTPVWVAYEGSTGQQLIDIGIRGNIITKEEH